MWVPIDSVSKALPARKALLVFLHTAWWAAFAVSAAVSFYSHWRGIGMYDSTCGDAMACANYFQLTSRQLHQLESFGMTSELYGGLTVILLFIQNLSSWMVGFVLYRYGWKDAYCVIASMMLVVTGTMFSTDDVVLQGDPMLLLLMQINVMIGIFYPFLMFFLPEGRFVPRWMAYPAWITIVLAMTNVFFPENGWNFLNWNPYLKESIGFLLHVLILVSQGYRYFHGASSEQKRQIVWLVGSLTAFVAGTTLGLAPPPQHGILRLAVQVLLYTGLLFAPISVGVMVLELRLRRMSVAFNRTLVFFVLSVMSIAFYALLVGVLGIFLQFKSNTLASLIAIGLVAVFLQPLRDRIQKQINLLVYGERDNPYQILSGLTRRLEGSLTRRTLLGAVVETVAAAFRLPYASIEIHGVHGTETLASYGQETAAASRLPLKVTGETVGWLVLGIPDFRDVIPPKQLPLLEDLLRQVSIAVQAVRLTEELHRSRERLVNAREEERRRLRRDLHDGLGSTIASLMLRTEEANQLHDEDPPRSKQALVTMKRQMKEIIVDIRRLVYALRPPALDEFGLAFALEELAGSYQDPSLSVRLFLPDGDLKYHAAVEVAVYRIVQEALTNVSRHSKARSSEVRLSNRGDTLHLTIQDDGTGLPADLSPGMGIRSMKERAEELGGVCMLSSEAGAGTRIEIRLPLEEGSGEHEQTVQGDAAHSFGG
ncbi:sensor histidine kinase [Cohnella candidum]|uniref:Oxygen sensor histidine kinase NreB n=1 Tax=Cohnella candidum TaxID=2674991 RepID=A0A3G3JZC1_9BACL|nr:sensor histidine kinase [Cohnella candidum]AYQ73502.1 hypothetical protein EAV92_13500 [Cohnella candidum]